MNPIKDRRDEARAAARRQTVALSMVILLGMIGVFGLSRWMDAHRVAPNVAIEEEKLYLTGAAARRASLGFNGLVADWYWMRALQYVGRKIISRRSEPGRAQLDDLGSLDLRLLYPLLDTTTTLDARFLAAYEYGAVVLPEIDADAAVKLLQKGIAQNPSEWRLYSHLGYIYWQRGDYRQASAIYSEGARAPEAPAWMTAMGARIAAEGGSRTTAREMYRRMYEQSNDEQVKRMAVRRLMQVDSLDEREAIRKILNAYAARAGRCAQAWKDVAAFLRAAGFRLDEQGAPLDPSDTPYVLVKDGCDVDLSGISQVPYK